MSDITFTPIGGGAEIGANCYLVTAGDSQLLLDSGIHPKKEGREALPKFSLLQRAPEAVLVSHGHIDHCGSVPFVLREFPATACYATRPTVSIMDRMLHNSVSVMTTLGKERNIPEYPLYTHSDVDYAIRQSAGIEYDQEFTISRHCPFKASFQHAGHVLGSAGILLRAEGHTVYYTGDICLTDQELLGGLQLIDMDVKVDTLIIESTRGAHLDDEERTFTSEIRRFAEEARKVLNNGGVVLVPAFALGRTQELLNIIDRLQANGELPQVPVYASGLGRAIYEVYDKYTDYLRPEVSLSPLYQFERIGDVWDPKVSRNLLKEASIVVATSGMLVENTPSAMIAQEMVQSDKHGVFFVGYLDPDTLGYKLLHANVDDKLVFHTGGKEVAIKLPNRQTFHFSAHAPREDLQHVINRTQPTNVIFVHGDPDAIEWLHANCNGVPNKFTPEIGEAITLSA